PRAARRVIACRACSCSSRIPAQARADRRAASSNSSRFLKDREPKFRFMNTIATPETHNRPERERVRVVEGGQGLVVTRIGKSFRRRPVVRAVSLSLRRGEVVGLLGPDGAGKTTCFYMITGLVPADYGTIELDGHDVTHLPRDRRARLGIGYLPQEASIFRGLTAEENIRATAELVESDPSRLEAMVEDLLAEF